jgi:ABC-type glutathione transport system ATPase component
MRGVSGAGKSTKAKSLVGEGVIHSTDSVIERNGDYNTFFNTLNESKDWSGLSKMHMALIRQTSN